VQARQSEMGGKRSHPKLMKGTKVLKLTPFLAASCDELKRRNYLTACPSFAKGAFSMVRRN